MRKTTLKFVGVEIFDRGWNRIIEQLREAGHSFTKVGLPEGGKTAGRHQMNELVVVGVTNEFGSPELKIPERPFMRETADNNREKITMLQLGALKSVVDGFKTVRQALYGIGEEVKEMIVDKIRSGPWHKNAFRTIQKKGRDEPLIDTSQMINSIQHTEVIYGR
jgi:hypothetical protein